MTRQFKIIVGKGETDKEALAAPAFCRLMPCPYANAPHVSG